MAFSQESDLFQEEIFHQEKEMNFWNVLDFGEYCPDASISEWKIFLFLLVVPQKWDSLLQYHYLSCINRGGHIFIDCFYPTIILVLQQENFKRDTFERSDCVLVRVEGQDYFVYCVLPLY